MKLDWFAEKQIKRVGTWLSWPTLIGQTARKKEGLARGLQTELGLALLSGPEEKRTGDKGPSWAWRSAGKNKGQASATPPGARRKAEEGLVTGPCRGGRELVCSCGKAVANVLCKVRQGKGGGLCLVHWCSAGMSGDGEAAAQTTPACPCSSGAGHDGWRQDEMGPRTSEGMCPAMLD